MIKPIQLEDVYKALGKSDPLEMLSDDFAMQELTEHLSNLYGPVSGIKLINYDPDKIVRLLTRERKEESDQ